MKCEVYSVILVKMRFIELTRDGGILIHCVMRLNVWDALIRIHTKFGKKIWLTKVPSPYILVQKLLERVTWPTFTNAN